MHFVCTYTLVYFPIDDDEYECVHYDDDDDHASYDTQGFANIRTSLQTASSTMIGPGSATAWECTLARVGCV